MRILIFLACLFAVSPAFGQYSSPSPSPSPSPTSTLAPRFPPPEAAVIYDDRLSCGFYVLSNRLESTVTFQIADVRRSIATSYGIDPPLTRNYWIGYQMASWNEPIQLGWATSENKMAATVTLPYRGNIEHSERYVVYTYSPWLNVYLRTDCYATHVGDVLEFY